MKTIEKDINDIPKNETEVINYKIDIGEFDMSVCEYSEEEDITEKLIFTLERIIRNSFEYKKFIKYLKNELDIKTCNFIPNLDIEKNAVGLEFHHTPLTLYDITDTILRFLLSEARRTGKVSVSSFEVAELVTKEHYENNVGLTPLTTTIHEMVHNDAMVVPMEYVNGNYNGFMTKYREYMTDDVKERFARSLIQADSEEGKRMNELRLKKKLVFLDVSYGEDSNIDDFFEMD